MRNVLVKIQFQPLRVHQHQLHVVRARFIKNRHQQRVDEHALSVPVEPAISKCGMAAKVGDSYAPMQIAPIASVSLLGELRNSGASMMSRSAMSAACRSELQSRSLTFRYALDQDRFRLQCQAKILGQPRNPAVLDAASGLIRTW